MAVYTLLEFDEIEALVAPLGLGRLVAAQGIAAGVENSTYFLDFVGHDLGFVAHDLDFVGHDCAQTIRQYVLTIAETLSREDLLFVARLMHDLYVRNLPTPSPIAPRGSFDPDSAVLAVREKPALLVPRVKGMHPYSVTPQLCRQIGQTLAGLHLATLSLGYEHESHRGLSWVASTGIAVLPHLPETDHALMIQELQNLTKFVSAHKSLPQAVIHGDLFRDNVLVSSGTITGIIDFFSAGTGYLLLDLAIVVNAWCYDAAGQLNSNNYNTLISSYCTRRQPDGSEFDQWGQILRIAALRFWVSRLSEKCFAGPHAPRGRGKDPSPYRRLIVQHRDSPPPLLP